MSKNIYTNESNWKLYEFLNACTTDFGIQIEIYFVANEQKKKFEHIFCFGFIQHLSDIIIKMVNSAPRIKLI